MRSTIAFSVAALAGSALAAPHYGRPANVVENVHYDVVVETHLATMYVTEGYQAPPKPSKAPVYQPAPYQPAPAPAPVMTTVVYEAPAPAPTHNAPPPAPPAPTKEAPKPAAPAPKPAPSKADTPAPAPKPTTEAAKPAPEPAKPAAPAAEEDYMSIVDEWRAKMGLSKLECSSELEKNAENVVEEGNGVMKHKLNPGTYGQVLAPGEPGLDNFKKVFVGGWLCEIPTLKGLDGVCPSMSKGWSYEGQTGHAEILTSPNYSKIGCRIHKGIWCCDLA